MLRPPLWRTLVTAPSSQAPLRVAAARRASPIQSGAVALGEDGRKRNPAAWALRACVCSHATAPRGFGTHSHTPMCFDTGHRQTMCLPCIRITQLTGILHPQGSAVSSFRTFVSRSSGTFSLCPTLPHARERAKRRTRELHYDVLHTPRPAYPSPLSARCLGVTVTHGHAAYEQYTHPGQTRRLKRVAHGVALLAARRHTRLSQFEKGGVTLKPKITQAWLHS